MDTKKIAGQNIRAFRNLRGISQADLGMKVKLHGPYIGAVERGERNISLDNLTKIANALDVPIHILLIEDAYLWLKQGEYNHSHH
jgi:transcriptional regulator with XRE-family HTH domain